MTGIELNWAALALSIIRGYSADTSIRVIEDGVMTSKAAINDDLAIQMMNMREEGHTWQQIGDKFGKPANTAFCIVKRYKERNPQRRLKP